MTGLIRRSTAVGLSVLILMGTLSPIRAAGETASPSPHSSTSEGADTPRPSQSTSYKLDPSQFSMLVSPTRLVVGRADTENTYAFSVVNRGQAPMTVQVQKRNFVASSNGSLNYQKSAPFGAAPWIALSASTLDINPGETAVLTAEINRPSDAEPGDHQAAIVFMVPAGKSKDNIKINRGVAAPVFITVPGKITSSTELTSLSADKFARRGPVTITASVRNTGTVHRDFRQPSPLTVQASGTAAPFPDFTVSRGATRDISTTWDPPLMCICHVNVNFTNSDAVAQTRTVQVIVFPWHLLALLIGAALLFYLLVRVLRHRYRKQVTKAAAALQNPTNGGDA